MRSPPSRSDPAQGVIPGAGDAPQRDLAQRAADTPLKPKAPQQPLGIGLFGDSHKQTEMF